MKNVTYALLCCSALLTACDNSNDATNKEAASLLDQAGSQISDATDAAENAAADLESALDSAKETADSVVDDAKESVNSAMEAAGDTIASVSDSKDTAGAADSGEDIYKKACFACHGTGVAGSPKLGDKAAWGPRIAQGNAVMLQHAIEGFKGKTGLMPPKGGATSLSDDEVSAAVDYMVSQVK